MLTKNISRDQRILILQQPLHQQFILHYSNTNGGVVLIHKLVDASDSDFELLLAIGIVLANEGKKVELLPKLHEKDVDFRRKVLNVSHRDGSRRSLIHHNYNIFLISEKNNFYPL